MSFVIALLLDLYFLTTSINDGNAGWAADGGKAQAVVRGEAVSVGVILGIAALTFWAMALVNARKAGSAGNEARSLP